MGMFLRRGKPPAIVSGIPVTITGTMSSSYAYVTIGDTVYSSEHVAYVEPGTSITVYVSFNSTIVSGEKVAIRLNGKTVAGGGENTTSATYKYTVTSAVTLTFSVAATFGISAYSCDITTT